MTFKSKRCFYKNNGKKGGRPKQDSKIYIRIPEIQFVTLTPKQYESLIKRYGYEVLKKALFILDNWLGSGSPDAGKYIGKNNYAHFRSDGWLLNEVNRGLK